jgi:hypothetical protein
LRIASEVQKKKTEPNMRLPRSQSAAQACELGDKRVARERFSVASV